MLPAQLLVLTARIQGGHANLSPSLDIYHLYIDYWPIVDPLPVHIYSIFATWETLEMGCTIYVRIVF